MPTDIRKARDLALLDAVDGRPREAFEGQVWRVVREGRDPTMGSPSRSRWCDDSFDALYTSIERDTAVAEIFALLSIQPVFPSKMRFFAHRLSVRLTRVLRLPDFPMLAGLGVDTARYRERDYAKTQEIADAAYFLDYQAIAALSARGQGINLVLFTGRIESDKLSLVESEKAPIDWQVYRAGQRHKS